jgi:hypothetical protein
MHSDNILTTCYSVQLKEADIMSENHLLYFYYVHWSGESHCGCAVPVSTKSHNSCDLVGSFKDTVLLIIIVGVWTGASNARPQNLPDL